MTNQQGAPEALQIAIALEREWQADALNYDTALSAAAELRRLHELTESQQEIIGKVADSLLDAHITAQAIRPAVGKALVSQLLEALETSRVLKADFESLESYGIENRKRAAAIEAARAYISTDLAALVEAQQRANHVQNPAEIEHVAGDVSKNGAEVNMSTQQEEQEPCPTCAALARTVMLDQVSFDRKPDCYGIRQITDDEGVEEWEDIRTSPDVAREEANDMMATGRGEIYEVVPLWTTPLPSPTPQADSQPLPIDMVLHCPACGLQHIDAPEVESKDWSNSLAAGSSIRVTWKNPPRRSHLCHGCGHIWRPADVPTNGVKAVKTTGKADSPIAASAPADSAKDEPLQAFDSPRAKALMRAWEEGWAACRDAEYVGEEAQNDAFNSSNTLTLCIAEDQQLPAPPAPGTGPRKPRWSAKEVRKFFAGKSAQKAHTDSQPA